MRIKASDVKSTDIQEMQEEIAELIEKNGWEMLSGDLIEEAAQHILITDTDWIDAPVLLYTHTSTGATDTKEGWVASYDPDELNERGLDAEEAFLEDENVTLIMI